MTTTRKLATILSLFSIGLAISSSPVMARYSDTSFQKSGGYVLQQKNKTRKYRQQQQWGNSLKQLNHRRHHLNQLYKQNTYIASSLPINELRSFCDRYPRSATCSLGLAGSIEEYSKNIYTAIQLLGNENKILCNEMFAARKSGQSGHEYVVSLIEENHRQGIAPMINTEFVLQKLSIRYIIQDYCPSLSNYVTW